MRTPSWDQTIVAERVAIERILRHNPSLRRFLAELPGEVYSGAVKLAASETGLPFKTFPSSCPFTAAEVFGPDVIRKKARR